MSHTLGRTPLDEGSARRRYLYLTTHNIHNRQTSMPSAGFESAIPASELPQTHALDRTKTVIGYMTTNKFVFIAHLILKHDTSQEN
jgi:hypothetical protein